MQPFGRIGSVAVEGDRLHIGDGTTWEIRTVATDGRTLRILRVRSTPVAVTAAMRALHLDALVAESGCNSRAAFETNQRLSDSSVYGRTVPAYREIKTDRVGRLWVRRYPRPGDTTYDWIVFTPDARFLGTVSIPQAFDVQDIGADYVIADVQVKKGAPPCSDYVRAENISEYELRLHGLFPGG
jgi:hypothetical protein